MLASAAVLGELTAKNMVPGTGHAVPDMAFALFTVLLPVYAFLIASQIFDNAARLFCGWKPHKIMWIRRSWKTR